jgi:hypothetical protein
MLRFLFALPFSYRQKKLTASRSPIDKEQFVSRISAAGGDERAAAIVWDTLLAGWVIEGFTPYPDDSLRRVYGVADEELDDDLIARTLEELHLPIPDRDVVERFGIIDSPCRVAQLVSECRQVG